MCQIAKRHQEFFLFVLQPLLVKVIIIVMQRANIHVVGLTVFHWSVARMNNTIMLATIVNRFKRMETLWIGPNLLEAFFNLETK